MECHIWDIYGNSKSVENFLQILAKLLIEKMFTNRSVSRHVSDRVFIGFLCVMSSFSAAAVEVMNSDKPSHLLSIILWCNI